MLPYRSICDIIQIMFYFYASVTALLDCFAMTILKQWSITNKTILLVIGVISYALMGIFFALAIKYQGLAITNVVWAVLTVLFTTVVGIYFFKEHLSITQLVAIFIVIVGLILISKP